MNRSTGKLAAIVAAGALTAGSLVATASPAAASPRTDFVADARQGAPELWDYTARSLWRAGKSVCRILDRGGHWNQVIDEVSDYGISSEAQAALVVSAVYNLCPGHKRFLDEWLNS